MTADEIEVAAENLADRLRAAGYVVSIAGAVTEVAAAKVLEVSTRTLRSWRSSGRGPECYVVGRARYPVAGLVRYLDKHTVGSTRKHAEARGSSRQPATSTDDADPCKMQR